VKYVTYSQPYVTLLSAKIFTFDHHHLMIENMLNTKEGNWNEQKRKHKLKFPDLTDRDLMYWDGKKDKMLEKLQVKLGKSKNEMYALIAAL
jgi:uncharacterized protein YjbJ (UPF0337 family)